MKRLAIATVFVSVGAFCAGTLHAQILLKATGTVYESSQNTAVRGVNGLFDGTPTAGSNANLGGIFDGSNNTVTAAGGIDGDYNPIAAFSLGGLYTVSSAGYAQTGFANSATGSINIFTMTLAQYNAYIASAPLMASQATARAGGLVAPPAAGAYQSTLTLAITDLTDTNYNVYNLTTPLTAQYFVLQFVNSDATFNSPAKTAAFLGAQEFEFNGVAVPEPATFTLLGIGLVIMASYARRRAARI